MRRGRREVYAEFAESALVLNQVSELEIGIRFISLLEILLRKRQERSSRWAV